MAVVAREAEVAVTLQTWEGLYHVCQMLPFLPETHAALAEVAAFLAACERRGGERRRFS
ncbi:MAG: hypothetical protein U9Q70_09635 [Chloroflexota bacterium]|nr:hypothetical protein [Chloroflexota bacterium]